MKTLSSRNLGAKPSGAGFLGISRQIQHRPPGSDKLCFMKAWSHLVLLLVVFGATAFSQQPTLAVVQKLSGTVGLYDATGAHLADVKVGAHPHELALSTDGRTL